MARDPRKATELQIHCAIVKLLRLAADPKLIWYAVPNGERRDILTAVKLKRMGVQPGVPDFALVLPSGRAAFIEVKREGGKLSREQLVFRGSCMGVGAFHAVARSVEDAEEILREWRALKGSASVARAA